MVNRGSNESNGSHRATRSRDDVTIQLRGITISPTSSSIIFILLMCYNICISNGSFQQLFGLGSVVMHLGLPPLLVSSVTGKVKSSNYPPHHPKADFLLAAFPIGLPLLVHPS